MPKIREELVENKGGIIRRRVIVAALEDMIDAHDHGQYRDKAFDIFNDAFRRGWQEVRHRHMTSFILDGTKTAASNSYLMDQLLRLLLDFTVTHMYPNPNPTEAEKIAILAVGGYGRGELAPFSDVDILFLIPYKVTPWIENVVEFILYFLWDLGMKVGHATRNGLECARLAIEDLTIATSLIESRLVWGDATVFRDARKLFVSKVMKNREGWFIKGKLLERDNRHKKLGDTRYVVEPNLKEGKGGLRDLQTTWWIGRFFFPTKTPEEIFDEDIFSSRELHEFWRAEKFLWSVRCTLHYMTGRAEERLSFDMQRQLASFMHYKDKGGQMAVERFMKHYFKVAKSVGDLTRILCAALENRKMKQSLLDRIRPSRIVGGFKAEKGRLRLLSNDGFQTDPVNMIKIFRIADKHDYDIHPETLRQLSRDLSLIDDDVRANPEANALFMEMLTSPTNEVALKRMNEAGVFGKFIPDFGRVVAQMQYDMYHHYTVDEHTIRALGLLARIEQGELAADHPACNDIIQHISSRRVLYVAVLLHDIAKGRKGDHSILGADVANDLCPRLGFNPGETETIAWLVRYHLLMSNTAFKRDLSDPQTIQDFCDCVKSPERLRLLLCLTVVDIRAVGPGVWNGWKGQLLRNLYYAAEEKLLAGHVRFGRKERVQERKQELENLLNWRKKDMHTLFARFYDSYWMSEDIETQHQNAELMQSSDKTGKILGVSTRVETFQAMTQVTVYTQGHPGVFARIVGALSVAGATIMGAKIHTTRDGMALDNFMVQSADHTAFDAPEKLEKLEQTIHKTLMGRIKLQESLSDRRVIGDKSASFEVEPVVSFDNNASSLATVIEVSAKDRQGLLHALSFTLYRLKLSIVSAYVATYGERAIDTFYVTDLTGKKITNKVRRANIEKKLLLAAAGENPFKKLKAADMTGDELAFAE